jgi:hypothetical protein
MIKKLLYEMYILLYIREAEILRAKCNWICYNKLDRRYRDFWLQQKNDIIKRHEKINYFY